MFAGIKIIAKEEKAKKGPNAIYSSLFFFVLLYIIINIDIIAPTKKAINEISTIEDIP